MNTKVSKQVNWVQNWFSVRELTPPYLFRYRSVLATSLKSEAYVLLEVCSVGESRKTTEEVVNSLHLKPLWVKQGMTMQYRHVLKGKKSEWRFYVSPDLTPENQPELWI